MRTQAGIPGKQQGAGAFRMEAADNASVNGSEANTVGEA